MKKKVSIYGGGWVGAPLAFKLAITDFDVLISASQVHAQAKHPHIQVVDFRASEETSQGDWDQMNQSAIQVWSIPPRRKKNSEEHYLRIVQDWVSGLDPDKVDKIIFLSSTSVYANVSAIVDETAEINASTLMAQAEAIVSASPINTIILRLGGLMGGDRFVAKYFSGKRNDGANCPVNYVHKDDVVNLIALTCEKIQTGIYNIVAPEHPTKQDVGMNDCEKRGMNSGYWDSSQPCLGGKIVSGDKIVEELTYDFKWPDPMEF
jgi:nucleoside-diphosphate-sugar epimerase